MDEIDKIKREFKNYIDSSEATLQLKIEENNFQFKKLKEAELSKKIGNLEAMRKQLYYFWSEKASKGKRYQIHYNEVGNSTRS